MQLVSHVACYSNILTVYHLGFVMAEISKQVTNCTVLINSVIRSIAHEGLLCDIRSRTCSLIITQSSNLEQNCKCRSEKSEVWKLYSI